MKILMKTNMFQSIQENIMAEKLALFYGFKKVTLLTVPADTDFVLMQEPSDFEEQEIVNYSNHSNEEAQCDQTEKIDETITEPATE